MSNPVKPVNIKPQFIVPQSAIQRMLAVNAEFEHAKVMREQMVELMRDLLGAPPDWILQYSGNVMQFISPETASQNGVHEGVPPIEA